METAKEARIIRDNFMNYCEFHYVASLNIIRTSNSSVRISMAYGLDDRSSIPGRDKRLFSTPQNLDRLWSSQSPVQWVQGALSLDEKRPRREADSLPTSSPDIKNR
jgi:hypothetical protein